MKIAIFSSGGASQLLVRLLSTDPTVEKIYHWGNVSIGISDRVEPLFAPPGYTGDEEKTFLLKTLETIEVDLIITTVLHYQLWKKFQEIIKKRGIPCIAPNGDVAMLEWSKMTSKTILTTLGIPTPKYYSLRRVDLVKQFYKIPRPFVLKFERDYRFGLQTIIITDDNVEKEFENLIQNGFTRISQLEGTDFLDQHFVVEEFISGTREYSYHAICNATGWKYIGSARDYKKRYEGDVGFNTAGMGAYSPVNDVDPIIGTYVDKIFNYLKSKNIEYTGFMYLGIMIDQNGTPLVLEINTRPGDPEIQTILPLVKNNLPSLLYDIASNSNLPEIEFSNNVAVAVRIVNKKYETVVTSKNTNLLTVPDLWPETDDILINYNKDQTVLYCVVMTVDSTIENAGNRIYKFLENKSMGDYTYRTDIGTLK